MPRRERSEYEQKLIDVRRITRVVKGGRRFRFRATMVIGNRRGKVGAGVGKGSDVAIAVSKAVEQAKKHMINVPIVDETIPYDVLIKLGAAKVFLKPAPKGTGIIAGGPVRAVMELSGIKNIFSKIYGTSNKTNNVRVAILALSKLQSRGKLLKIRGKKAPEVRGKPKPK